MVSSLCFNVLAYFMRLLLQGIQRRWFGVRRLELRANARRDPWNLHMVQQGFLQQSHLWQGILCWLQERNVDLQWRQWRWHGVQAGQTVLSARCRVHQHCATKLAEMWSQSICSVCWCSEVHKLDKAKYLKFILQFAKFWLLENFPWTLTKNKIWRKKSSENWVEIEDFCWLSWKA